MKSYCDTPKESNNGYQTSSPSRRIQSNEILQTPSHRFFPSSPSDKRMTPLKTQFAHSSRSLTNVFNQMQVRPLRTSQGHRRLEETKIPKPLQLELKKDELRSTFITDVTSAATSTTAQDDGFRPDSSGSFFFSSSNLSKRNVSASSVSGRRKMILKSRATIDQAIKQVQNASSRLAKYFEKAQNERNMNQTEKDINTFDFYSKTSPKTTISFYPEHGMHKILKSNNSQSMQIARTISHIPQLLQSLDDIEQQQENQRVVEEKFHTEKELREAVKKINGSKSATKLAGILLRDFKVEKNASNGLFLKLKERSQQLQKLGTNYTHLENLEAKKEIEDCHNSLKNIQNEIEIIEKKIEDIEMEKIAIVNMKVVRYRDNLLKRKENIELMLTARHLSRFLGLESEEVINQAKEIDELYRELVESKLNKMRQQKRDENDLKDLKNKGINEEEALRLFNIESRMKQIERNSTTQKKKQILVEEQKVISQQQQETFSQQNECKSQLNDFQQMFHQLHEKHNNVTSIHELLSFCTHVNFSTLELKKEKSKKEAEVQLLRDEVREMNQQLETLKLKDPKEFENEKQRDETIIKSSIILTEYDNYKKGLSHQLKNSNTVNINQRKTNNVLSTDVVEARNIAIQKYSSILEEQEKFKNDQIFKMKTGLSDLHSRFFDHVADIPFQELIRLKKKKFDEGNIENSVVAFGKSISTLAEILEAKQSSVNMEQEGSDTQLLIDKKQLLQQKQMYFSQIEFPNDY